MREFADLGVVPLFESKNLKNNIFGHFYNALIPKIRTLNSKLANFPLNFSRLANSLEI